MTQTFQVVHASPMGTVEKPIWRVHMFPIGTINFWIVFFDVFTTACLYKEGDELDITIPSIGEVDEIPNTHLGE